MLCQSRKPRDERSLPKRKVNDGSCAGCIFTIDETNLPTVCTRNLLGQSQAYAASLRLGCVEGHEKIFSVGYSHSAVFNPHNEI